MNVFLVIPAVEGLAQILTSVLLKLIIVDRDSVAKTLLVDSHVKISMNVRSKTNVILMHYVLIQMDHIHANVKQVSQVMVAHVLISTSVALILAEVMRLVKTLLDRTLAYLAVLE